MENNSLAYTLKLLPDELLFSLVGRQSRQAMLTHSPKKARQVFGINCSSLNIGLPKGADYLLGVLAEANRLTVDELLMQTTLIPFFLPFAKPDKDAISAQLSLNLLWGVNSSSIISYQYPLFCPKCASEDVRIHGEAYWHRSHQIPDIRICCIHQCLLHVSVPPVEFLGRMQLFLPSLHLIGVKNQNRVTNKKILEIAQSMIKVLEGQYSFCLKKTDYAQTLSKKGYLLNHSSASSLIDLFTGYHSQPALDFFLRKRLRDLRWLIPMLKNPQKYFHPLRHVLINNFVAALDAKPVKKVNEPTPIDLRCINKFCPQYQKTSSVAISRHIDPKSKRAITICTCTGCGMIYTHSILRGGKPFLRVKEHGHGLTNLIQEMLSKGMKLKAIARELGQDVRTIQKIVHPRNPKDQKATEQQIESHRKQWLAELKKFDRDRVKSARFKRPELYAWLYRNDKPWFLTTNKLNRTLRGQQLRLDWKEIDDTLYDTLASEITKLKQEQPQIRITKSLISKILVKANYVDRRYHVRLPRSFGLIEENCETVDTAQLKRVKQAILDLEKDGQEAPAWKVMRKAGLKSTSRAKELLNRLRA